LGVDGRQTLNVNDIDWIEAAGNYAQLWVGPRSYVHRESLQVLEERLHKHGFIRAHRRALVRLDGVRELTRDRAGELVAVLGSGARITISRRRSAAFSAAVRLLDRVRTAD
jgi:two-component system, LytTR family, response regulator